MKKILKEILLAFAFLFLIGCGYLEPNEVDEAYVRSVFEKNYIDFLKMNL